MIRFANVSKAYLGGKPALQGLSFHLPVGSMTYLAVSYTHLTLPTIYSV